MTFLIKDIYRAMVKWNISIRGGYIENKIDGRVFKFPGQDEDKFIVRYWAHK